MTKFDFSIGYKKLCANYGTPNQRDVDRQRTHSEIFYDAFRHLAPERWLEVVNTTISYHEGRFPQVATIRKFLEDDSSSRSPSSSPTQEEITPEIREMKRIDNGIYNLSRDNKRDLIAKATEKATKKLEKLSGENAGMETENGVTKISRAFLFTLPAIVRGAIMTEARNLYVEEYETPEPEEYDESPHSEIGYGRR